MVGSGSGFLVGQIQIRFLDGRIRIQVTYTWIRNPGCNDNEMID